MRSAGSTTLAVLVKAGLPKRAARKSRDKPALDLPALWPQPESLVWPLGRHGGVDIALSGSRCSGRSSSILLDRSRLVMSKEELASTRWHISACHELANVVREHVKHARRYSFFSRVANKEEDPSSAPCCASAATVCHRPHLRAYKAMRTTLPVY